MPPSCQLRISSNKREILRKVDFSDAFVSNDSAFML